MRIEHINDVLPAVEGRKDFVVKQKDGYTVIDYVFQDKDTFDDPLRVECRGIKFDAGGNILARPFQKFFNVGEKEQPHDIDLDRPHLIMEKLDGSMIHPAMVHDSPVLMTRMGVTDVAKRATESIANKANYMALMCFWMGEGFTPIFEYTGPENRIVIRYEESELTLLGVRHKISGEYLGYNTILSSAEHYEVPVVKCWESKRTDIVKFLEHTRALEDDEGRIIKFEDGHMLKIKADDYVMKHRALDDMGSKKKVLAVVLEGAEDDLMPILDADDRTALVNFSQEVNSQLFNAGQAIHQLIAAATVSGADRKEFATECVPNLPKWMRPAAFKMWEGDDPTPLLKKTLARNIEVVKAQWRGE